MRWAWVCWVPLCLGPPGPLAWTLVARPGDGGLLTARAPGGTDGLCAWVTNDLGTDVLGAPSVGGAGLGRARYPGGRCGAVKDAWLSVGAKASVAGGRVAAPDTLRPARLGSRGPLAGTLAARLGSVWRRLNASRTHPTARGALTARVPRGTDSWRESNRRAVTAMGY
jgi:hypothetical protein